MRRSIVVVMALLVSVVPVGAQATTEDRAVGLHARAEHLEGWLKSPQNQEVVYIDEGSSAEVRMPPQTAAAVDRHPGGTTSIAGAIVVRQDRKEDIADGNLAAGTANASSFTDAVTVTAPGVTISARSVRAFARASCDGPGTVASASEGSHIGGLTVNGESVSVGAPNEVSRVLLVGDTKVTVDALRVVPTSDGLGWSTVGLVIRFETVVPAPSPLRPVPTSAELWIGATSASLTCAE